MARKTDPEKLAEAGTALHGPRFQRELADDLAVSERTMRRWMAGTSPVPDGVWAELAALMGRRIVRLNQLVKAFEAAA